MSAYYHNEIATGGGFNIYDDLSDVIATVYKEQDARLITQFLNDRQRPPAIGSLKEEREKQWGSGYGKMGWDRYCSRTFLEVIRAKFDRALQCWKLLQVEKSAKVYEDALDSVKDGLNYGRKLLELMQKDDKFFESEELM